MWSMPTSRKSKNNVRMTKLLRFKNRLEAGKLLARRLGAYAHRGDVIVLALPRGGVPVGFSVAQALQAPLDILQVRKLGVPGHEECAMGAIANGGLCVLQPEVLGALKIPREMVEVLAQRKLREMALHEKLYRANRPALDVRQHVVILVDDGLATGSTMLAAVHVLRKGEPARVIAAVPVAPRDVCRALRSEVDDMICLHTPVPFYSVGLWYEDFEQISDDEVKTLLDVAYREQAQGRQVLAADQAAKNRNQDARRH
ncbi:MAG TPA: phosphoribosyltransferase [Janthinobacterium sp.]|jgi:putative phosphoribosyl transferase|nr:phosphoribosyltransferase [Janthinobacterium sp.]